MRSAVALTFDFDAEEVWIAADPDNASRPGVLSQGAYGARVGVPLLLEVLDRQEVRATFFVPGAVAERYPDRVAEIVAAGHELALHGYTHTSPDRLEVAEEEAELTKSLAVLSEFAPAIAGYRSPSWDFSPATLGLLAKHGLGYSSNFMDDVRPYLHPGTDIVELPVQWMLDDAPYFWFSSHDWLRSISPTSAVEEIWRAELEGIHDLGGVSVFTMHPQLIGRPGRVAFLERFITYIRSLGNAWMAPCEQIARCLR